MAVNFRFSLFLRQIVRITCRCRFAFVCQHLSSRAEVVVVVARCSFLFLFWSGARFSDERETNTAKPYDCKLMRNWLHAQHPAYIRHTYKGPRTHSRSRSCFHTMGQNRARMGVCSCRCDSVSIIYSILVQCTHAAAETTKFNYFSYPEKESVERNADDLVYSTLYWILLTTHSPIQ